MENLFLLSVLVLLSILMIGLVLKNRNVTQFKARTILYFIVFSLLIGFAGILGYKEIITISSSTIYYTLIIWMLALGIANTIILKKILPWFTVRVNWTGLLLTFGTGFLGSVFILIAFQLFNNSVFVRIYLLSVLIFIVPFLFYTTYSLYMNIPVKVLRKWQYPIDKHIDDPTDREMDSPLVVGFEFKKKTNDENMTTFRAKAPKEMIFGKLFYYFINDYNDRNSNNKIEFLDENNNPHNWIFYHKPKWFRSIRYIDPDETNSFNFIKENSVIVCKRVIEI